MKADFWTPFYLWLDSITGNTLIHCVGLEQSRIADEILQ